MCIESFQRYLEYERRVSTHTLVAYRKDLDQFTHFCEKQIGIFSLLEITGKNIRSWVVFLLEHKFSPKTVHRKITTLKSFYRFCLKEGLVENSPADVVVLPKLRRKLPCFVDRQHMDQLFDCGYFSHDFKGRRDFAILNLFYGTGMRLSELVALDVSSVNIGESTVKVVGKGNKERIIPFPKETSFVLQEYLSYRADVVASGEKALIITDNGERGYYKFVYRTVKRYLAKVTTVGKKSPHVLRHSYATQMMNGGADVNSIKELLGHANLSATQIYTHTTFENLKRVYKQAHPRA